MTSSVAGPGRIYRERAGQSLILTLTGPPPVPREPPRRRDIVNHCVPHPIRQRSSWTGSGAEGSETADRWKYTDGSSATDREAPRLRPLIGLECR